jgi:hypothetical protein
MQFNDLLGGYKMSAKEMEIESTEEDADSSLDLDDLELHGLYS